MHHLAGAGSAGGLCQTHGAHDIDRRVELRIVDRTRDRDLGGEVEDDLRLRVGQQPDQVGVHDVGLGELETVVPLGLRNVLAAPRAEVVDADDAVPVRK